MSKNLEQHKKSDSIKWAIAFIAIIILAVGLAAALTQGFTNANPYGWLDKKTEDTQVTTPEVVNNEPTVLVQTKNVGMSLMAAAVPSDPRVVNLSANLDFDEGCPNTKLNWEVHFASGSDSIDTASGPVAIGDVVTIEPNEGSCKVSFLKPFGEQIKVKVSADFDSDVYAEATFDFVKHVEKIKSLFINQHFSFFDENVIDITPVLNEGTLEPTSYDAKIIVKYDDIRTDLGSAALMVPSLDKGEHSFVTEVKDTKDLTHVAVVCDWRSKVLDNIQFNSLQKVVTKHLKAGNTFKMGMTIELVSKYNNIIVENKTYTVDIASKVYAPGVNSVTMPEDSFVIY